MPLGFGRARSRRRGLAVGAAIGSARAKKNVDAGAALAQPVQDNGLSGDSVVQLKQLAELKDQGILTQEEFDAKKKQILGL